MIPVWLIPVLVQAGSKLIDLAFCKIQELPEHKRTKVFDKIEANDRKEMEKWEEKDYGE